MSNNEFIELLYKKENELEYICKYHGINNIYDIQDIIQEVYIKLLNYNNIDKYIVGGKINMYIIFAIVRNTIFDFRKKENKYNNNDITDSVEVEDIEDEEYFKYEFVKEEIDKIDNWYDKAIITHYVNDFHTIRSLAKVTSIGYTSIQPTIHRFRLQCQANWIKKIKNDKN